MTALDPFFFLDINNIYKRLKINPLCFPIPMIYNLEETDHLRPEEDEGLSKYLTIFKKKDLVVFSHSRQLWKNLPPRFSNWGSKKKKFVGKRNNVLIKGFALYVKSAKCKNPLLVLAEYGPDVENSKSLISELGIKDYVLWLPRMPRKKIMLLLKYVDIGADQFGNGFWGGTALEIFSIGLPIINYVRISEEDYRKITGHEMPFILRAQTPEEIAGHLLNVEKDREYYRQAGKRNRDWFNRYMGIELAREYKRIIEKVYEEKRGICCK